MIDNTSSFAPGCVAHFFVPLPEPLGLADGFQIHAWSPEPLEQWLDRQGPAEQEAERLERLEIALTFHHARSQSALIPEISTLLEVATSAFPTTNHRSQQSAVPQLAAERTIVQMSVPLEGRITSAVEDKKVLTEAFDRGLEGVRAVQRAYYSATQHPLELAAREAMPPSIPVVVTDPESSPKSATPALFSINIGFDADVRKRLLNPRQVENLFEMLEAEQQGRVFAIYPQHRRQAIAAFDQRGDYEATALFAAVAAEVFLDDLLGHLLWEELLPPEEAAVVFDTPLVARVKSQYHDRVGGSWDVSGESAVAKWLKNTASLRNRVIHGGYSPNRVEAEAALDGLLDLEIYVGDRLSTPPVIRRFPRTALALLGRPGLERRGAWTRRVEEITMDGREVPWAQTYARWRAAMRRETTEGKDLLRRPSVDSATPVVVLLPNGIVREYAHDHEAGYVAEADAITASSEELLSGIRKLRSEIAVGRVESPTSVTLLHATAVVHNPKWIPEYRAIPGLGVMRSGKDIDL